MKEYTLLASASAVLALWADHASGVRLLCRPRFYAFLAVVLFFKIWVNGFLTAAPVVLYDRAYFLGARIGTIPVEDFLFGFGMVMLALIVWEKMKRPDPGACKERAAG